MGKRYLIQTVIGLILLYSLRGVAGLKDLSGYSTKNFLISTAPTGCQPKGLKMEPLRDYLYLAEMCGKIDPQTKKRVPTASIYDLQTRRLSKTLITPVGIRKGILANTEVDFSLDGKWAFIARAEGDDTSEVYRNMGLVTVINTQTQKIAKYLPVHGQGAKMIASRPLVRDQDGRRQVIYVANYFSDDISVFDVTGLQDTGDYEGSLHYVGKIRLQTNFRNPQSKAYFIAPRGVAFSPDGKYALVLATETGSLFVLDAVRHRQLVELAPIDKSLAGRELNVRHIVISKDGKIAYLSHMRGNAVSRMDLEKLIQIVQKLPRFGANVTLPAKIWEEILIPFGTGARKHKVIVLESYPKDHPNFPGGTWSLAHPNTIVLDPHQNRYLYVSSRTTSVPSDNSVDPKIKGKIDIIDTRNGEVVFSLVGGSQPTALEISRDGGTLVSSGFIDERLYFFDVRKILDLYEKQ